jgi:hypothetical protein
MQDVMESEYTFSSKVKQSLYRPGQALSVPGGWGPHICRMSANDTVRLSALRMGRLYLPENIAGTHFCQRLCRPQDHSGAGRIQSITSSGIEFATFRLLAQCLDQLRHPVPRAFSGIIGLSVFCCRFQWPRSLRRRSAAERLLGSWVWIAPGTWTFVSWECLCCQVEVYATGRSLVQRSPTDCGVCPSVIKW